MSKIGQHWIWYIIAIVLVAFAIWKFGGQAETLIPVCEDKLPSASGNTYTWNSDNILKLESVTDCFSAINGTTNSTVSGKIIFNTPGNYPYICSDDGKTKIYGSSEGIRSRIIAELTPLINITEMTSKILLWKINVCGTKDVCTTNVDCGANSVCEVATQTCKVLTCTSEQETINHTCLYTDRCTTSIECISTEECKNSRCEPLSCGEKQILENHACKAVGCTKNEHCVKTADFDCNMENETITGTCSSYTCSFKEAEECTATKGYWNKYIGDYIPYKYWYIALAAVALLLYYGNKKYKWMK